MLISCPNYDTVLGKHDGTLTSHSILDTRHSEQWRFPSNKNLIHTCHGPFLVWSFLSSRSHDSVWFWIHLIMRTLLNFKADWHGKLWYSEHHNVFGNTFTFLFPCLPHIYIDSNTPQQCQEFIHRYCENLSQCSLWSYYQAYYKEGGCNAVDMNTIVQHGHCSV